jgi:hypothetical protein
MPASQIFFASKTLTDAQIKALPTTPIVLVPPTEVINYTGLPTKLQLPLFGFSIVTNLTGAYTNVDAAVNWFINLGSDNSFTFSTGLQGNGVAGFGGVAWYAPSQLTGSAANDPTRASANNLDSSLLDNAIVLAVNNQGDGNFTGGDPANALHVTVFYTIIDV